MKSISTPKKNPYLNNKLIFTWVPRLSKGERMMVDLTNGAGTTE
jgi:hypothetical protein